MKTEPPSPKTGGHLSTLMVWVWVKKRWRNMLLLGSTQERPMCMMCMTTRDTCISSVCSADTNPRKMLAVGKDLIRVQGDMDTQGR